jgi:peptidoglycan/xylan/chitin deacetylase (PgdA/CDA1 family)
VSDRVWTRLARGGGFPHDTLRTIVSLTFDDGWANQRDAAAMLSAHGMRGTFYVNSNRVGTPGFLTWHELEALASVGHDIGGHGLDHVDLTTIGAQDAGRQIEAERSTLLERGFLASSFAYPYGAYEPTTERIVRECGYASGRGAWGLRNISAKRDRRPRASAIPPPDPYAILTPCCIDSRTTPLELTEYVSHAEKARGWIPFVLHRVCDGSDDDPAPSITLGVFTAFLDWLDARAVLGTVVRTVAEVVGGTADPQQNPPDSGSGA